MPPLPKQSASFAFFFFAYYAYVGVFSPYASLFFADKGVGAAEIGILMSIVSATRIFGPNLWGWVADHSNRRVTVLRASCLLALMSFAGMFGGSGFAWFFAVMCTLCTCTSAQGPLSEAVMLAEMRGDLTHYGRLRLWGSVGFIVAVVGAGHGLDQAGTRLMPWICSGLLALVLLAGLCMREPGHEQGHSHSTARAVTPSVRSLLLRPEVAAFFVSTFLMIAAHSALYVFYSMYLVQFGYSKTVVGLMWSLGVVAEIGFFYFQASLFRRWGVKLLMLASLTLAVLRFLMIGFGAHSLWWLLAAQVLHAATFAAHHSASVINMQRWFSGPLQARGQALYYSISYGLGGLFGGLFLSVFWGTEQSAGTQLLGHVPEHVPGQGVFFAAAALALLGLLAAMLSFRWIRTNRDSRD